MIATAKAKGLFQHRFNEEKDMSSAKREIEKEITRGEFDEGIATLLLDTCETLLDSGKLSSWEASFIESLIARLESSTPQLSEKQQQTLKLITDRIL